MFYKMISNARDRWYASDACAVKQLVGYIIKTDRMRDAQIEAIKTYLFLKIACENKPLAILFCEGKFNSLNLNDAELSAAARTFLKTHPAAAALFEYSRLKNEFGEQVSAQLEKAIKKTQDAIDYKKFFNGAFYGVSYTDYLFSLPMGAGKTYLMAAFVYLDLYFALNEPDNPAFAHNFIIFAPSGLKSSVVPSLRTIQKFDPAWVIPEPAATDIKRKILFEVLDQGKTAKKSNKTKNPNVQKLASHQPFSSLFGLVAVTNAEKVILDRIEEKGGQINLFEESGDAKDSAANELRRLIGELPALSVFIDEVHHAVSDEIKLRAVVNKWAENHTVNSVIGFSGTPYLEKAEKSKVTHSLSVASAEIGNIVYYYPLIDAIGNFLKTPQVKISDVSSGERIIERGVRDFLSAYKGTVYHGGLTAKLGVYCGTIEKLEQVVFPLVARVAGEYGLPAEAVLKFHKGNKEHPQPADSQMQFDILDKPVSKIRIVLLVQIGKEGWDCRSLTGIILSQEGDCPKNMVLQTSCRCLRQVVKGMRETALIYLNKSNSEKLNAQLRQQYHISLKEFSSANNPKTTLTRYDRTAYLKLPPVEFFQLKVSCNTVTAEEADPDRSIPLSSKEAGLAAGLIKTQDGFTQRITDIEVDDAERGRELALFTPWLCGIVKAGFGFLPLKRLKEHEAALREVFAAITYDDRGTRRFSSKYDRGLVEANIRKGFYDKRGFNTKEEFIPQTAGLLNVANFTMAVSTDSPKDYYPPQDIVEKIIRDDAGELEIPRKDRAAIEALKAAKQFEIARQLESQFVSHFAKDRSFHYLPYKTGSGFEEIFLKEVLALTSGTGLEVYYNGDRALTDFKIRCYKRAGANWRYIGVYTPDFLIIQRKGAAIYKAVIVETKGEGFAENFAEKRDFMYEFKNLNNSLFGYERFEFLYLEDILPENARIELTNSAIKEFFGEEIRHA